MTSFMNSPLKHFLVDLNDLIDLVVLGDRKICDVFLSHDKLS